MKKYLTAVFVLLSAFASAVLSEIPCYGSDSYIHVDIMKPDGTYTMWKEGEIGEIESELYFYPSVNGPDLFENANMQMEYEIIYKNRSDEDKEEGGVIEEGERLTINEDCTVKFYIEDKNDRIIESSRDYIVRNGRRKSLLTNLKSFLISVISI